MSFTQFLVVSVVLLAIVIGSVAGEHDRSRHEVGKKPLFSGLFIVGLLITIGMISWPLRH